MTCVDVEASGTKCEALVKSTSFVEQEGGAGDSYGVRAVHDAIEDAADGMLVGDSAEGCFMDDLSCGVRSAEVVACEVEVLVAGEKGLG